MALRSGSLNRKLAENVHRIFKTNLSVQDVELLQFHDFPMPVYDGDVEDSTGIPMAVKNLAEKIANSSALVLSTPEYNGSIPGPFKNAIDWISRVTPSPWSGKQILLLGASPGALGAIRGLWHARVPLEALGAHVFPEMIGVPKADQVFDEQGLLKDSALEERLKKTLNRFNQYISNRV